tara:strand:- start:236 stop:850 length:615 start_codon:yes stop_codon:yes gene_type:complete
MKIFIFFCLLTLTAATVYLKTDDFESKTQGKKALVAFKAPWCGHCKKLKPEWDKLAENVEVLIGEVDCTVEKDLCSKHGVQGYPTIKYSDGYGWTKYEKGRDYDSLETFVEEELGESCFDDPKLCSEEELEEIEKVKQLSQQEVDIRLEEIATRLIQIQETFDSELQKLQTTFQKLQGDKNTDTEELNKEKKYLLYSNTQKEEL